MGQNKGFLLCCVNKIQRSMLLVISLFMPSTNKGFSPPSRLLSASPPPSWPNAALAHSGAALLWLIAASDTLRDWVFVQPSLPPVRCNVCQHSCPPAPVSKYSVNQGQVNQGKSSRSLLLPPGDFPPRVSHLKCPTWSVPPGASHLERPTWSTPPGVPHLEYPFFMLSGRLL